MCWEETEETVIHEDNLSGELQKEKQTLSAYGADSIWRDLDTRHLLGEICKEIYITIAGDTTIKGYMARNAA